MSLQGVSILIGTILATLVLVTFAGLLFANPVFLQACSKDDCIPAGSSRTHESGTQTQGAVIIGLGDSHNCPGRCTQVTTASSRLHVMGHWLDVSCRAWGGDFCVWDRGTVSRAEMVEALEQQGVK